MAHLSLILDMLDHDLASEQTLEVRKGLLGKGYRGIGKRCMDRRAEMDVWMYEHREMSVAWRCMT